MKWHLAATPRPVQKALRILMDHDWMKNFYLSGGTALALRKGHRVSVDLDFFSSRLHLDAIERERIKASLGPALRLREEKEGTLHAVIEETEVSFFHYGYPLVRPVTVWDRLSVASIEDIALMKIGAAIGRGARKDFLDLYTILQRLPLPSVLKMAQKKFPDARDFTVQTLRALVYFDDAEKEPMPRLLKPMSWDKVKTYFEMEVPRVAKTMLMPRSRGGSHAGRDRP